MTIPTDRPVLGRDLEAVRQQFALLTSDACWVFGMSITRWTQVVRQQADEPVSEPKLALLVRYLAEHPELQPIPVFPSPSEMYELLKGVGDVDAKTFGVLWGAEASAGYRWLREDSGIVPGVSRLMHYVRQELMAAAPEDRPRIMAGWRRTVNTEATARGVPDVFNSRTWTPKNPAAPSKSKASKREE